MATGRLQHHAADQVVHEEVESDFPLEVLRGFCSSSEQHIQVASAVLDPDDLHADSLK